MKGFCRKSKAPSRIARATIGTSPCPDTKMIGAVWARADQAFLQANAREPGHAHVQDEAVGSLPALRSFEYIQCAGETAHRQAKGFDQKADGESDGIIVIHHAHERRVHDLSPARCLIILVW